MDEVDEEHAPQVSHGAFGPEEDGVDDQAVVHDDTDAAGQADNQGYAKHIPGPIDEGLGEFGLPHSGDNADENGDFKVSWSDVPTATSYILEESDNLYFVDPVVVYSDTLTEKQIEDQGSGNWYYRVRAVSSTDQGPWSQSKFTFVQYGVFLPLISKDFPPTSDCTPDPPGESDNIGDALIVCSDQAVPGKVSYDDEDWDDVYQIYTVEGQMLTVALSGSGGNADLYLFNPFATDIYGDPHEAYSMTSGNDEFIEGTVLVGGYWYIDVSSAEGTTNYNLVVTLSDTTTSQAVGFSKSTDGRQPR